MCCGACPTCRTANSTNFHPTAGNPCNNDEPPAIQMVRHFICVYRRSSAAFSAVVLAAWPPRWPGAKRPPRAGGQGMRGGLLPFRCAFCHLALRSTSKLETDQAYAGPRALYPRLRGRQRAHAVGRAGGGECANPAAWAMLQTGPCRADFGRCGVSLVRTARAFARRPTPPEAFHDQKRVSRRVVIARLAGTLPRVTGGPCRPHGVE